MTKPSARPDSEVVFKSLKHFTDAGADGVAHGFFGRRGGVSAGIFSSLNCGPGSGDAPDAVAENRSRVSVLLGTKNLLSLHQIHSPTCLKVDAPWSGERPKADAFVTDKSGMALSILTADCAPVLFYGIGAKGQPVVGAAHAGWRGAAGGVLDQTVQMMAGEYGVQPEKIRACIGPCIGFESYEVGRDFFDAVMAQDAGADDYFRPAAKTGHFMFDLAGYCAGRLHRLGLKKVLLAGGDTYAAEADYFSYRRTTHRKESDYGRQISVVVIA